MRINALGASVFLGVFLLPVLCFAQSLSGPNQCEGGLGNAAAYFHPDLNKCGSGSGYVGLGDAAVVAGLSNATDFGSCTYAYNRAYATGSNPACSLRRADGQTCTILISKNGLVDISAGTPCTGTGPTGTTGASTATQFCTATTCYVSTVYNQRNSNNFTNTANNAAQPVFAFNAIGSLPAIQCSNANGTYVTAPITATSQPYTYAYVAQHQSADNNIGFVTGTQNGTTGSELGWISQQDLFFNAGTNFAVTNVADDHLHSISAMMNGSSSAVGVDGTSTTSVSMGTEADSANMSICNRPLLDIGFAGFVGEVGRWAASYTSAQATALCANQQLRWGVLANPLAAAGNIVCGTPKLVLVVHGDSITYGYNLNPQALAYPNLLAADETAALIPTSSQNYGDILAGFTAVGNSGYTLDQSALIWVDPYASNPTSRLIIFAGTNDETSLAPESTIFSYFLTYFNARLAAGWLAKNIIVVEMLPRNFADPFEANREAYNALLSSNASTYGYQEVPLGTDTLMGQTGQWSNTTYYQDGVHPTAVGQALLASDMFGPTASCSACPGIH
jgi:lysophospholipase L1-like esterase